MRVRCACAHMKRTRKNAVHRLTRVQGRVSYSRRSLHVLRRGSGSGVRACAAGVCHLRHVRVRASVSRWFYVRWYGTLAYYSCMAFIVSHIRDTTSVLTE